MEYSPVYLLALLWKKAVYVMVMIVVLKPFVNKLELGLVIAPVCAPSVTPVCNFGEAKMKWLIM